MFLFEEYPKTQYDLNYKNKPQTVTNIMVRFKIVELIKQKRAVYYNYSIQEGERADVVAYKYYGDSSLWWIIARANGLTGTEFQLNTKQRYRVPMSIKVILRDFAAVNSEE